MSSDTTRTYDFLLAGIGGQGTILASNVLAEVGLAVGFDAKKAEVHGLSQLGGSVNTHVRWNYERVYSPLIALGEADYLVAFEKAEALRYAEFLQLGGKAIINDQVVLPLTVTSGGEAYPTDEQVKAVYAKLSDDVHFVPGIQIAKELGNAKVANVVALGALSNFLPAPKKVWLAVIEACVPQKFVELNQQAFQRGRKVSAEW